MKTYKTPQENQHNGEAPNQLQRRRPTFPRNPIFQLHRKALETGRCATDCTTIPATPLENLDNLHHFKYFAKTTNTINAFFTIQRPYPKNLMHPYERWHTEGGYFGTHKTWSVEVMTEALRSMKVKCNGRSNAAEEHFEIADRLARNPCSSSSLRPLENRVWLRCPISRRVETA